MNPFGLYLHLPFCAVKCFYCDFAVVAGRKRDTAGYLKAMNAEMQQKERLAEGSDFTTLYFGGGTPSLFSPAEISSLLGKARTIFSWTGEPEITLESNPASLTLDDLRTLHTLGVNRLSLGVQSFSDATLQKLGRTHRRADILEAVSRSRTAGFDNLNLDLIYGVPGQTLEEWERTVEEALALRPEHLSVYNLTLEEGTTFGFLARQGRFAMPPEEDQVVQGLRAREMVMAAGYLHYEISNYARPGFECRHNLTYWQRGEYLGLGMAAHSCWNGQRSWNTGSLEEYLRRTGQGEDPSEGMEVLDEEKKMREAVFLGLRLVSRGIALGEFKERFHKELPALSDGRLRSLVQQGLVVLVGDAVRLTPKGLPLADEITVELI